MRLNQLTVALALFALVGTLASSAWAVDGIAQEEYAFLGISSSIAARTNIQAVQSKTSAYIQQQLAQYGLNSSQLVALPLDTQREVLSTEGRQRFISIQERKQIVPFKTHVPRAIIEALHIGSTIDYATLERYGVLLPETAASITGGGKQALFNDTLVLLSPNNIIIGISRI